MNVHQFVPAAYQESRELTPREQQVLRFVLAGRSNKWTAFELGISSRTVESHRSRIYRKCGVRNAMQLMAVLHDASTTGLALAEHMSKLSHYPATPPATAIAPIGGAGFARWLPGQGGPGVQRDG